MLVGAGNDDVTRTQLTSFSELDRARKFCSLNSCRRRVGQMNLVGEGTVSDLSHQYFAQVTGFVRGSVSFDQLYDWVCAFAADLADSTDPMVRRLDDRFWELIGEQGRGDRSVETVREELGSISAQVGPIAAIPFEALSVPR